MINFVPITKINNYDRLFSIGDIHGCAKELRIILQHLMIKEKLTQNDQLIFIGDYIDRGENSPEVLNILIRLKKSFPKTIFLRGNHEDMFLSFLGYSRHIPCMYGDSFLMNGGRETLSQYLISEDKVRIASYKNELSFKLIPKDHRRFLLETKLIIDTPDAYFVHAGFSDDDINKQDHETTVWDRSFQENGDYCLGVVDYFKGKKVVHGHTPINNLRWKYEVKSDGNESINQINIDTGCVYHMSARINIGRLTCLNVKDMTAFSVINGENNITNISTEYLLEEK